MSLVRVRRTHSAAGLPRKKHVTRKKPAWDDTQNDLTTMKATLEEQARRKAVHQSKHALTARLQNQNNILNAKKKKDHLSISNAEARQLAIMKEVLYDQQQLQNVIAKSDQMMYDVKDLFGDDPKRFEGFPNVTTAPNSNTGNGTLVAPEIPISTRMEALSDSVMDASALNDLEGSDSDEQDGQAADPITYQPKMNMERFQQFLESEEKNQSISTISGQAQLSHLANGPGQSTRIQYGSRNNTQDSLLHTPPKDANESVSILKTPRSAINDTRKIKKSKKRVIATPRAAQQNTSSNFNLTDLRKVLEGLQDEIADFEKQTGRNAPAERHRQENFSGYTLSLIDSVTKLTRYLKDTDFRIRSEVTIREQLMQDVVQLTSLIDALTSDIITTQEDYTKMKEDFVRYKMETSSEIHRLKTVLMDAGLMHHNTSSSQMDSTPPRSARLVPSSEQLSSELEELMNVKDLNSIPEHLRSAAAAVLLSPPVRKSRLQNQQNQQPQQTERQNSVVELAEDVGNQRPQFDVQLHPRNTASASSGVPGHQFPITSIMSHSVISHQPPGQDSSSSSAYSLPGQGFQTAGQSNQQMAMPQRPNVQHSQPTSIPMSFSHPGPIAESQRLPMQSTHGNHQPIRMSAPIPGPQGGMVPPYHVAVNRPGSMTEESQAFLPQGNVNGHASRPFGMNQGQSSVISQPGQSAFNLGGQYLSGPSSRISVPRPSPLVQSNVDGPLQGLPQLPPQTHVSGLPPPPVSGTAQSHIQAGNVDMAPKSQSIVSQSRPVQTNIPTNPSQLSAQIAELNRQHEEAQLRMQNLLQQQRQQQEMHKSQQQTLQMSEAELDTAQTKPKQQGLPSYPVSPPISPISQKSDKFMSLQPAAEQTTELGPSTTRGITISLPSMSLESSAECSPSPKRTN